MLKKQDFIVVFVTAAGMEEAEKISTALVEKKLAACCNLIAPVNSVFHWKGETRKEEETLIIIKTVREKFPRLERLITSLHSYEVPEIIALPIIEGHKPYLDWINEETGA